MKVQQLRQLLNKPGIIRAPGAYDAWSARLIEQAGFPAVYMTGYGVSASAIGRPDIGLLTMTEMAAQAKKYGRRCQNPTHCRCRQWIWRCSKRSPHGS